MKVGGWQGCMMTRKVRCIRDNSLVVVFGEIHLKVNLEE